jgi:redox-sensitive bicupin YhaK (pirin superfamily)
MTSRTYESRIIDLLQPQCRLVQRIIEYFDQLPAKANDCMTIPITNEADAMREAGIVQFETLLCQEGPKGLHPLTLAPLLDGRPLGPFMSIVRFRLKDRVFPPHPHAGFSAITYVLESSATAMRNRDSLGDYSSIKPGGSHWTIANSGMMHEETPDQNGSTVDGFRIFLNHPSSHKHAAPHSAHFDPDVLPSRGIALGVTAKAIIGAYDDLRSPATPFTPAMMLQIDLEADARYEADFPAGWSVGLLVETGTVVLSIAGGRAELGLAGYVVFGPKVPVALTAKAASRVFLFGGLDIDEPIATGGPFIMNDDEEIADAFTMFRAGAMGSLSPRRVSDGALA